VQRAIAQMQEAIDHSAKLAQGQAGALVEVQGIVMSLQHAIAELAKA
jgi:hypothetical protein